MVDIEPCPHGAETRESVVAAIGAALFARGGALYAGLRWNAEADRKARRDAFHAYWRKR